MCGMAIKLLATDIDGTLTIDRSSVIIPTEVIDIMRRLETNGVLITLVSSNALPIVAGLRKYLGLKGPVIAESGALVYFGGDRFESLTRLSARKVLDEVLNRFSKYIDNSWQNTFRLHDYALKVKPEFSSNPNIVYRMIKEYVESRYDWLVVGFSGYALHLTPIDVSKGKALRYVMDRLGLDRDEVVAIGDSSMDVDLIKEAGIGVAVSNADEELKRVAKIVTSRPSYEGFIELAEMILEGKLG